MRTRGFAAGLVVGVFLFVCLAAGMVYSVVRQGVRVAVEVSSLASGLGEQVEVEARERLSGFIDLAKEELPKRVAREIDGQFESATVQISGVSIRLPAQALDPLQARIRA